MWGLPYDMKSFEEQRWIKIKKLFPLSPRF